MFDIDKWMEILTTMVKNPLRTILTSISVAVGIFILVVLLGLGQGLQNGVNSTFGDDVANAISVHSSRTTLPYRGYQPNRRIQIEDKNREYVVDNIEGIGISSSSLSFWGASMKWENEVGEYSVRCVQPGNQEIGKTQMTAGRYISYTDLESMRKVAVIGQTIVDELFVDVKPIGEYLEIFGIQFLVVGTFNDPNNRWENRQAYLPLSTGQKLFSSGSDRVEMFTVSTGETSFDETVLMSDEIDSYMRSEFAVHPDDSRGIDVYNANEEAKQFQDIFLGIEVFIFVLGILTLMAGIIGVSNIMSIVVKERTKEIGVRKALGATPWSIVSLILQESIFMTLMSGFVGLIVGVALLELIAGFVDHEFFTNPRVSFWACSVAIIILAVSGALSGLIPSLRAASIKPVEALRDE